MRLSAIDSLQHGLLNLRANWQLILLQVLQSLLVMVISLVGLVPIVMVLGFTFVRGAFDNFGSGGEAVPYMQVDQYIYAVVGEVAVNELVVCARPDDHSNTEVLHRDPA